MVIELQNGSIHATVADKGRGIPALTLKEINAGTRRMVGVGVLGMKERIRQVGGNLEIRSDRSGTLIVATLPAEYSRAEATPLLNHDFSVESTHLSS